LNCIPTEIRVEQPVFCNTDFGVVAATKEIYEWITGYLGSEAGATPTLNTPFPVQINQIGYGYWLGPMTFLFYKATFTGSIGYVLVLERTLTPFVADGTVKGMIDEQELQDPLLGLYGLLRLGAYLHTLGHRRKAGGLEAESTRSRDLCQACATHAHRLHPRVIAKPRQVYTHPLSSLDN
jgi:hypothetical protein